MRLLDILLGLLYILLNQRHLLLEITVHLQIWCWDQLLESARKKRRGRAADGQTSRRIRDDAWAGPILNVEALNDSGKARMHADVLLINDALQRIANAYTLVNGGATSNFGR